MLTVVMIVVAGWLAALGVLALFLSAYAHPGRLDAEGCHKVRHDYEHKSGKIDKAGTEHCHRLKQGRPAILDGREQLSDPNHPDEDDPRPDQPTQR